MSSKPKGPAAAGAAPRREDINRLRVVQYLINGEAPIYAPLVEPLIALHWIVQDSVHRSGYVLTQEGKRRLTARGHDARNQGWG